MKAVIIGAGGWGTTLALLLAEKGHSVTIWAHETEVVNLINEFRENRQFLPGFQLPAIIEASTDLTCLKSADLCVFVVPTQFLRSVAAKTKGLIAPTAIVVSASKGIEEGTLKLPAEIIEQAAGLSQVCVLSGPNLSKEIAKGLPAAAVVAGSDKNKTLAVQQALISKRFRVYTNDDVIGAQLGGALKNVVAIAAGIADGLELGDNAKSAMLIRGIAEITRLGVAMGGSRETFAGLTGMGDLITTCSSRLSRNHSVGEKLAKGQDLKTIMGGMKEVAEGVPTVVAALELAKRYQVELPIAKQVNDVLYHGKSPYLAITELMTRAATAE